MSSKLTVFERWWLSAWPHRWHIRQFVPRFLRECPEPFRGEVLEVGSGSGWTSQRILETFPQVELTATDVDPKARAGFEKLTRRYGQRLKFREADLLELPFDRESFDIVVALHVLHHVDDLPGAIQQFLRVTRPGGLVGVADDDPAYLPGPLKALFRSSSRPSRDRLVELLKAEGCEVLAVQGRAHFSLWARKPYPIGPGGEVTGR